ncbi:MAG: hypothetical protein ACXVHK_12965 [Solirubrobacteraceae bacterium]
MTSSTAVAWSARGAPGARRRGRGRGGGRRGRGFSRLQRLGPDRVRPGQRQESDNHERRHAGTHYEVCWKGPSGDKRCWHRTTGAEGHASRIGTDAPDHVGSYIVKWIVNDHVVAHWRFFNHIGD